MPLRGFNWRLALALWLLSLPGVVAAAYLALPLFAQTLPPQVPLQVLMITTAVQSAIMLALAACVGTALGPAVRLTSPLLEAVVAGDCPRRLRDPVVAGVLGGLAGAGLLLALPAFSPSSLSAVDSSVSLPLAVRLLYGGIAEEVLIRWGLMTTCLWVMWRVLQRGAGRPRIPLVAASIGLSAILFGVGHLPAAAALVTQMDLPAVAFIVFGNAAFGVFAGYLFWKYGLESAIVAHVLAHAFASGASP